VLPLPLPLLLLLHLAAEALPQGRPSRGRA
jgi:hypothetical protein